MWLEAEIIIITYIYGYGQLEGVFALSGDDDDQRRANSKGKGRWMGGGQNGAVHFQN